MKTTIFIIALALFAACKKPVIKPQAPTAKAEPMLFNYNVAGFTAVDSCAVYVNDVLTGTVTTGYHLPLQPGDVLTFYVAGHSDSTAVLNVWQDKNELPRVVKYGEDPAGIIFAKHIVI